MEPYWFVHKKLIILMITSYVVGHVPRGLSKAFSNFLSLPVSTMLCIVNGKRLNPGTGLGLEILVCIKRGDMKRPFSG